MKIDIDNNFSFDLPKNKSNVMKVMGVGGGGSNAVNHMFQQGITGVDFVVCNTDSQALDKSPVPNKIQLGVNLTEGLGAGAKHNDQWATFPKPWLALTARPGVSMAETTNACPLPKPAVPQKSKPNWLFAQARQDCENAF